MTLEGLLGFRKTRGKVDRIEENLQALGGDILSLRRKIDEIEARLHDRHPGAETSAARPQSANGQAAESEGPLLRSKIDELETQIHQQHLKIGLLEAQLHAANYQARRQIWQVSALYREFFGPAVKAPTPPREIPADLVAAFTLDGRIPIEHSWFDESRPSNYPLIYTDEEVDAYLDMIKRREWSIYGMTDHWLWDSFEKHPIRGKSVAVMGSLTPWYESSCLAFGGSPTTIEYNKILVRTPRLKALTVDEFERAPAQFDAAISISSFEHDGLGRYGDPLDPDGDLKAMRKMKQVVSPGGLMYFAVPIGSDRIIFNMARVYGRIRLPLLLEGWTTVESFGFSEGTHGHPGRESSHFRAAQRLARISHTGVCLRRFKTPTGQKPCAARCGASRKRGDAPCRRLQPARRVAFRRAATTLAGSTV